MKESLYPDFETAFRALYKRVEETPHVTEQLLSTIWFEIPGQNLPLFFESATKLAHKLGILTEDGELTNKISC